MASERTKRKEKLTHISREELMAAEVKDVATDELIDWLAALAHANEDWEFIRKELLRRASRD